MGHALRVAHDPSPHSPGHSFHSSSLSTRHGLEMEARCQNDGHGLGLEAWRGRSRDEQRRRSAVAERGGGRGRGGVRQPPGGRLLWVVAVRYQVRVLGCHGGGVGDLIWGIEEVRGRRPTRRWAAVRRGGGGAAMAAGGWGRWAGPVG
jgi:hypothetical protein